MKYSLLSRSRRSGFTLVELLVVIGIIAILAGVTVVGVASAIKFAKRTKANSACTQISTAVLNYYTEYGLYPTAAAGGADNYYAGDDTGAGWAPLIIGLCGNINPYTGAAVNNNPVPNTRAIPYLTLTHSDVDNTGRMVNPFDTLAGGVATPPPNGDAYFFMVVDTDYSNIAGDTGNGGGALLDFSHPAPQALGHGVPGGVAVWCSCDQNPGALGTSHSAFWAHTY